MTIIINNLRFIIYACSPAKDRVTIKSQDTSTNHIEVFHLYRSRSNMQFWRLCLLQENRAVTGRDYVQTTFIHLRLQLYINEQLKGDTNNKSFFVAPILCSYDTDDSHENWADVYDHMNSRRRLIKLPNLIARTCGDAKAGIADVLVTSTYLKTNFTIDLNSNELMGEFETPSFYMDAELVTYKSRLYKINLKGIGTLPDLTLYFRQYDLQMGSLLNRKNVLAPVGLTRADAQVTPFGLYSSYVSVGNYICQLFESKAQCTDGVDCTEENTYIGDRYRDTWPLRELTSHLSPSGTVHQQPTPRPINPVSIEIDNYKFTLLARSPTNRYVAIQSLTRINGRIETFCLRARNRDMQFWRFYIKGGNYKDEDFVQTKFVDLRLQQFINEQLLKDNSIEVRNNIPHTYEAKREAQKHRMALFDVHSMKRVIKLRNFTPLALCGDSEIGTQGVMDTSTHLKSKFTIDYESIAKLEGTHGPYEFKFNSSSIKFDSRLFKINLRGSPDLTLYFMEYDLEMGSSLQKKNALAPIGLTGADAHITRFGLYSTYVPVGNYICTLFEEKGLCPEGLGCIKKFVYIGDRYQDIWPLRKLTSYLSLRSKTIPPIPEKKDHDLVTEYQILQPERPRSIEIDSVKFTLVARSERNDCVTMQSVDLKTANTQAFDLTTSLANPGFWTTCEGGNEVEGIDFIQSTFIHLDLQQFIRSHLENPNTIPVRTISCSHGTDESMEKHINSPQRFTQLPDLNLAAREWLDPSVLETSPKLKHGVQLTSNYLADNFTLDGSSFKEIGAIRPYKFRLDATRLTLCARLYKINLKGNCPDLKDLTLYFMKYDLVGDIFYRRDALAPIGLTTTDARITSFGLYSQYVPVGEYIYKIFLARKQNMDERTSVSSNYAYIGDIYVNIWPLREITASLELRTTDQKNALRTQKQPERGADEANKRAMTKRMNQFGRYRKDKGDAFNADLLAKLREIPASQPIIGALPTLTHVRCGEVSLDQGATGTCYILSVITLFQNENVIHKMLHDAFLQHQNSPINELSGQPLLDVLHMLNVSAQGPIDVCPMVPTFMRDVAPGDLNMGGSHFMVIMYILHILQIYTNNIVNTMHNDDDITGFTETLKEYRNRNEPLLMAIRGDMLKLPLRELRRCLELWIKNDAKGRIKGFLLTLPQHSVAVNVCYTAPLDFTISVCNSSAGNYCQTVDEFVTSATDRGYIMCFDIIMLYHITDPIRSAGEGKTT